MAINYDSWAKTYDSTRGVSASVIGPLMKALGSADGRMLLDVGGGTGNYTTALNECGFRVTHCDPSPGMVRMAEAKAQTGGVAVADGQSLPFRDRSFDCAIAIKVLNHVPNRPAFMREARRVMGTGPLVLVHATKECIEGNWITYYLPSLLHQARFEPELSTVSQMKNAGFRNVETTHIMYADMADGSAQALKRYPEMMLSEERIMNTSLLSRLPVQERQEAFETIRSDQGSGRLPEVISRYEGLSAAHGDGTLFVGRL